MDVAELEKTPDCSSVVKVHRAMCTLFQALIDRISGIFPDIEAARPRCSSGIRALCLLQNGIEKARQLFRNCSESSRFYLAITGDAIVSRFERTRNQLEQSLSELQTMVPVILEPQISQIVDDLRRVAFIMDRSEQDAGKVLRALLQKEESILSTFGNSEIQALQFAASRIHLKRQKDLSIEKRSIRKMLDKVKDSDRTKKTTLRYLWYLLEKHDTLVLEGQEYYASMDHDGNSISYVLSDKKSVNVHSTESRLRYARGEDQGVSSYELTPQTSALGSSDISSISISSCGSLAGLHLQVSLSSVSLGSEDTSFNSDNFILRNEGSSPELRFFSSRHEIETALLSDISLHTWESQCTAIDDVQIYLDYYTCARLPITSKNFVEPVVGFLKDAVDRQDERAQNAGSRLFLTGLHANRSVIECINQEVYHLLATFLGTPMTKDVLAIFELSVERSCGLKLAESGALNSTLKILDTQYKEFHETAIKILHNLSKDPCLLRFLPLDCIPRLVPFLRDSILSGRCIQIFEKLFYKEEARVLAARTEGCISAIAESLETENCEEQEHGVSVLLTLCSQYNDCCRLVMDEGIIPTLICIQVNGNERGKACAFELLRLLRDVTEEEEEEEREDSSHDASTSGAPHENSENKTTPKQKGFFSKFTGKLKR